MIVYKLTPEQKLALIGLKYDGEQFFNPVQDADNNWIISEQEFQASTIAWVRELPAIEFNVRTQDNPFTHFNSF